MGTGTYKITDTYLKDFANQKIQAFLDEATKNPALLSLIEFGNGSGGNPSAGNYDKILDGNGNALPSGATLQNAFKAFAASLEKQIQGLTDTMGKTQRDLLLVDYVLGNGDHNAELTAAQMGQTLKDILGSLNGPPTNPPANPPTTGH